MANIITVTGAAGGTGRTTVTANLATVLSYLFRKRVMCVNLGGAYSFSCWFNLEELNEPDSYSSIDYPINLHDIKEKTRAVAANLHAVQDWSCRQSFFKESIELVQGEYDFILIDGMSLFGLETLRACALSDLVIIAGGLSIYEPNNLRRLVQQIAQTQALFQRQKQHVRSVLSYRVEREDFHESMTKKQIADGRTYYMRAYSQSFLPPLFKTSIRADKEYEESFCECRPVATYNPDSKTVEDYVYLSEEILSLFWKP